MKKYFYDKKRQEGSGEQDMLSLLLPSFIGILLCLICLTGMTWAWFTSAITTTSTISGASFNIEVEIKETDTSGAFEGTNGSYALEANKDYQLGAPGFDTLSITVMDKANLLTALISGDLDYYAIGGSISEENRPIAEEAGFTVLEGTVPSTFYELMLNNETIDSVDLRQAINMALDKELLCQQSSGTLGAVTNSSILPDTPLLSGPDHRNLRSPGGHGSGSPVRV